MKTVLTTPRLILRHWKDSDLPMFAEMNADPRVMEFFPKLMSQEESDSLARKLQQRIEELDFGLWAVEVPGVAEFIGLIGLNVPSFEEHFTPCVEIGWRLAFSHWGKGYATEGAKASLRFAFEQLALNGIVAMTTVPNVRSRRVIERIGMTHNPVDDFDHPSFAEGHALRRHVLYRLSRKTWAQVKSPPQDASDRIRREGG